VSSTYRGKRRGHAGADDSVHGDPNAAALPNPLRGGLICNRSLLVGAEELLLCGVPEERLMLGRRSCCIRSLLQRCKLPVATCTTHTHTHTHTHTRCVL
jgi:hypothetical protein